MNEGVEQALRDELDTAEDTIQRALKLDPSVGEAWLNLGLLHLRQGRTKDAATAFRSGLEVSEGALAQEHRFRLAHIELGRARDPSLSYDQQQSTTRKILEELRTVVEARPLHASAWHDLAQCHEFLGQLSEADAAYRRAIEIDPTSSDPFVGLAMMYLDFGYANVAMAVLEVNARVNRYDAMAWLGLGQAHMRVDNYEQAIDALKKARAIDPDLVEVLYVLGMAHAELHHRERAIEVLLVFLARADEDVPEWRRKTANNTIARMQDVL